MVGLAAPRVDDVSNLERGCQLIRRNHVADIARSHTVDSSNSAREPPRNRVVDRVRQHAQEFQH